MLRPRIIVCLDVKDGRVVKGTKFRELRDVGDPVELAHRYEEEGADEVVFLDISASHEGRGTLLDTVRRTAEVLFVPLTVGGGVRTVQDMDALLRAGADKVSVNSGAVRDPSVLTQGAERFGSQCVVISIDAAREGDTWFHYTHGGRERTNLEAVPWAEECVERGAGEVLLTSIDRDGVRGGYDLELTRSVSRAVSVPVIASGGAGATEHLRDGLTLGEAQAVLLAGILHDELTTVGQLKDALIRWGIPVRPPPNRDRDSSISSSTKLTRAAGLGNPMNRDESQNDRQIRTIEDLSRIRFDRNGLVPVVSQHRESGEVLMLAWANRQALEETLATRIMHFWSRSRDSLWQKGETSGNTQSLVSLHLDCDGDALLALVNPVGPACHTGDRSCFGLNSSPDASGGTGTDVPSILVELAAIVAARGRDRPEGSYTTRLLEDENLRLKKLGEEVSELIVSLARGGEEAPEEAADLIYHLIVALQGAGRGWDEVEEALARRRR